MPSNGAGYICGAIHLQLHRYIYSPQSTRNNMINLHWHSHCEKRLMDLRNTRSFTGVELSVSTNVILIRTRQLLIRAEKILGSTEQEINTIIVAFSRAGHVEGCTALLQVLKPER